MDRRKTLYVTGREQWRTWLTKHGKSESEVWLIYYKQHTGRPRIPYDDAVEEAICFGWIDSIVKSIDDEKFMQKFTPRRNSSKWSALNKRRLRKMIGEGRMTDAGLATVSAATLGESSPAKPGDANAEIPRAVKRALEANAKAWKNFASLTPSRQQAYIRLIMDAKKEETRERRVQEVIELLTQSTGNLSDVPRFMKQALVAKAKAWENFQKLAPSHRRQYIGWIMHAKQEETRQRRLHEAIVLLEQNKKLGLK